MTKPKLFLVKGSCGGNYIKADNTLGNTHCYEVGSYLLLLEYGFGDRGRSVKFLTSQGIVVKSHFYNSKVDATVPQLFGDSLEEVQL